MSEYVADTHALVWHLSASGSLSAKAASIFTEADAGLHRIYVPSIVLVELVYLIEKQRLDRSLFRQMVSLLNTEGGSYALAPLDIQVAQALPEIDRTLVPDMPDRIIAATAKALGLPLITRDPAIGNVGSLQVLW
jgi:predicted nucleic acid-binding protein